MPDEPPPLIADAMLGRLCKWLRLLGYDVVYANTHPDHQIVAQARTENRVVLTRDRQLAQRKGIRCLWISSQVLEEQIQEVVAALGLPEGQSHCPQCNTPLTDLSSAQVKARVPKYIFNTQRCFTYCTTCDKVYWPGSHWEHIQMTIAQILLHSSARFSNGKRRAQIEQDDHEPC